MKPYSLFPFFAAGIAVIWFSTGCSTPSQTTSQPQSYTKLTQNIYQWRLPLGEWKNVGGIALAGEDEKAFELSDGNGVFVNHPTKRTLNLLSQVEHGDVSLHVEFAVPKGSNSGVYLQGRYEIQVFDSWGKIDPQHSDCGGIYQRWSEGRGFEGHAPKINASLPPGEWQTFDIVFRAPRFDEDGIKTQNARFVKVVHNGVTIHENVELTGPTRAATFDDEKAKGPLMLQGDHGPVAYRNILVRPLALD